MAQHGFSWAVTKAGAPPAIKQNRTSDYPHHKRAERVYTNYITGFCEEEIAKLLNACGIECTVDDVTLDIQHIQSLLPIKTVISQNNDRDRILCQRKESQNYRALLNKALTLDINSYIAAGLSPTAALKEYRQAVGMEEKPGGMNIHVQQNSLSVNTPSHGIKSSEDVLRQVMSRMGQKQLAAQAAPIEVQPETIEAESETFEVDEETDLVPDPDA